MRNEHFQAAQTHAPLASCIMETHTHTRPPSSPSAQESSRIPSLGQKHTAQTPAGRQAEPSWRRPCPGAVPAAPVHRPVGSSGAWGSETTARASPPLQPGPSTRSQVLPPGACSRHVHSRTAVSKAPRVPHWQGRPEGARCPLPPVGGRGLGCRHGDHGRGLCCSLHRTPGSCPDWAVAVFAGTGPSHGASWQPLGQKQERQLG